ncbi:AraC family transcriptional regulator [Lentilactobacillus sp. Marseille-Q4993]|uniref:AraC family transcriptional regulator n=1 Tax=Lentilactobacillus sp. Marseille-Q4993 TaxID=3039492 RepID=UPI0024BD416B|nr:AraC family transcriptional regulator [Lentilactobacillus sp. Marseille-Q4993]
MIEQYLSIPCLPLPTYVQSGHVVFQPGERHPNRNNFQFFVMMFMVRGELFIAEDDQQYTVKAGEMFTLQPKHHHYSWKPMEETTEYYWVHFAVKSDFIQDREPKQIRSSILVPSLHYYSPDVTLFLKKQDRLDTFDDAVAIIKKIFMNSNKENDNQNVVGFWQAQQLFIDLLQQVQMKAPEESRSGYFASEVQRYLRDHFDERITNEDLARVFHIHPNSIVASMKKTYGITPNLYLTQYRMEEAVKRLLSTDEQVSKIAVEVGYQNIYYFSIVFKKYYNMSPSKYRKSYTEKDSN